MTTGVPTPPRPTRSRPGKLRRIIPLAFVAWFVLEIWLLTLVADAAGGFTVLLLLVAGAVLGGVVIKAAGRRAFKNLSAAVQQAQDGALPQSPRPGEGSGLVMLAGLFLIVPGMISDAVGLLLLLPPVRGLIGRRTERALERRMAAAGGGDGFLGDAFQQARMRRPDGKVVPGEVIRDREPAPEQDGPRPPLTP
ncbi:FxsA family membrane protein [Streptomyces sp. NPDC127068]|uniref:FxsA family membrane protein n=1 Tax=Streptomyces sp. NPDC127068 TaxID=3347127 RepID=UPI00364A7DD7